ncbi:MAG: YtxH domain-containing protein [Acidobacteria bacterium]|nr:YtxH domain-containing protein [Acidobacteriota bacterium]
MSREENSSATDKLTFLLIGAGIGATLALLFAPKKGSELRSDIADYTRKGIDVANEGARQLGNRAGELYDTGRERAVDAYGQAREKVGEVYGTAKERVGEVYGQARERVASSAESVTDLAARQKDQIAAAIEAGKQAYLEEKKKMGESARAAVESDEA